MAKFAICEKGILGSFTETPYGWRFISWTQNGTSRKHWASPEAALPRSMQKVARIVDATDTKDAAVKAAELNKSLAGRLNELSHRFPYDSVEANTLTEAAQKLK